jgi:hypothetical protein
MNFFREVWAGRASVVANQQELTTCAQKCGQEKEGEFYNERITSTCAGEASNYSPQFNNSSLQFNRLRATPLATFPSFFKFIT